MEDEFEEYDYRAYLKSFWACMLTERRRSSELLRTGLHHKLTRGQRIVILKAGMVCGGWALHSERGSC